MLPLDSGEYVNLNVALKISADHRTLFLPHGITAELTQDDFEFVHELIGESREGIRAGNAQRKQQAAVEQMARSAAIKQAMGKGLVIPTVMPGNGRR